ncbi:MAG: hypothetical protein HYT50_02525 [Candidatus Wildermuthbacteria bacterium]|nr:hypothetical protein [Candidatus Wildermuthbacteria bacterium]
MQLHQLKRTHRRIEPKRIGRGGKKGMSSGRGGQKLGASQPRIREVLKRYPKLRGYRFSPNLPRNPLSRQAEASKHR